MENKQNPFELFDGEWFKDATSQLCQDGWPAFIVPLNIGIRKIRESHQELKSALESANAEIVSLQNKIAELKEDIREDRVKPDDYLYLATINKSLESENKKLVDAVSEINTALLACHSENAKLRAALEEINREELNAQRPGGGYSRSAKISFEALGKLK